MGVLIYDSFATFFFKHNLIFSDYTSGFGGKFGVQNDRVDKSAMGWDHIEKVEKHDSQKGTIRFIQKLLKC